MLAYKSQVIFFGLIAILLPTVFSFPYSIYDMRRASRTNSNSPSLTAPRQRYDEPSSYRSLSSSSQYYGNYDSMYDSDAPDNYYVDDDEGDDRPEREYLYGKPTYHGEYKPTRYYYARAPSYNYYNDHVESTNPLDDLHEEMLQEDHNRQRNVPSGKGQWNENLGQPKSLSSNFMKNLMARVNPPSSNGMNNAYDDEEMPSPYYNDDVSKQNAEPVDYFDPLKFQAHPFNQYDSSASLNKQNYYNHENHENQENHEHHKDNEYYKTKILMNKNHYQNDHRTDLKEDKEEKELESLRTNLKNTWEKNNHNNDNDDRAKQSINEASAAFNNKHNNNMYTGNYDSGFDYDEDEWINWNRKRSLPKNQLRPLKALEYELTKTLQQQSGTPKIATTTKPTTTTTTTSTISSSSSGVSTKNKLHEYKGQKEVVLSRPATPLRRHYPDNILDALTKTANEIKSNQNENTAKQITTQNENQPEPQSHHVLSTKKHKRYVSSETSLVQQLNDLKQKITA